jgi:hypothetical protein
MALTFVKPSGIDTTGSYTMGNLTVSANLSAGNFNVTGPTTFSNISLNGNIIPTVANAYSLGNSTYYFKDVYVGPGSLYIDGQKVLESVSNTITVTADINQSVKVTTSGSGDVILDPTGTGVIQVKGPLQFEAGTQATSSDGNAISFADPIAVDAVSGLSANTDLILSAIGTGHVKVDDNLIVTGDLTIQGTTSNLSVSTLTVQDNIIDISAETTGTPTSNAGIRVIRGDDPATQIRWNETDDVWQITNDGTNYLTIVGKDSAGNISVGNLSATGLSGTLSTAAQPSITSVGTLTSLTVSGLVTATSGGIRVGNLQDPGGTNTIQLLNSNISVTGNIVAGAGGSGNVTATFFIGNGSTLTSITGANVTGYVPLATEANTAGTVTTNAQPNITSVGTLTSLDVTGNTTSGNLTLSGLISANNSSELRAAPAISAGSLAINLNAATIFDVTLNAAITTFNISNVQSSGRVSSFVLIFTADGTARSVTWPASFKWTAGNTAPTLTSTNNKKDVFTFFTVDGGTSWQAFISGQNI